MARPANHQRAGAQTRATRETYQEDANLLTAWCGGWYDGLAHRRFLDYKEGRLAEHDFIEYCKARLEEKVIHAIGVVIKEIRAEERMSE